MRKSIPYIEILRKLHRAGVEKSPVVNRQVGDISTMPTLQERVDFLLGVVNKPTRPATNMLFFVMYDIESDKVRYHIAKYLERKGCTRIQRSIFLADLDKAVYDQIKADLTEVQSLYDNHDSIIVCPVSTDQLRAMKVIGEDISVDIIIRSRNTLFF
ncbi:CRISPR-associated endonuclease Cas2 [Prevotella falsenii]|uniref:CRISPR-associated endonuclease Cas2 n=1 Tax=Prevotella falsenii TaxID=515414 RepID=UPI000469B49E|nr:CRISPR-associated endonuclease Cas2 [Prevotella falsenii]